METQPQLLMLQKTMVLAEGVGRLLAPEINMWTLARPLIEDWMRTNRGPEARIVDLIGNASDFLERLPQVLRDLDRAATQLANDGISLSPTTIELLAQRGKQVGHPLGLPLWLGVIALIAIAVALWR